MTITQLHAALIERYQHIAIYAQLLAHMPESEAPRDLATTLHQLDADERSLLWGVYLRERHPAFVPHPREQALLRILDSLTQTY